MNQIKAFIIVMSFVMSIEYVTSECCQFTGTTGCCGKGRCNIFCCNCDDGCKSKDECRFAIPIRGKREIFEQDSPLKRFSMIDLDQDGKISFDEANKWLYPNIQDYSENNQTWFKQMDLNQDGILLPNEFDASL